MATIKEYLDYAELAQAAYGIGYSSGTYLDNKGKNILIDPNNKVKKNRKNRDRLLFLYI